MSKDHYFTICGEKFLWRYTQLKGNANGWTYTPDPRSPLMTRKILVHSGLSKRAKLEVEVHEFIHAANPNLSEDAVSQQGRDLARILWALGYRQLS